MSNKDTGNKVDAAGPSSLEGKGSAVCCCSSGLRGIADVAGAIRRRGDQGALEYQMKGELALRACVVDGRFDSCRRRRGGSVPAGRTGGSAPIFIQGREGKMKPLSGSNLAMDSNSIPKLVM